MSQDISAKRDDTLKLIAIVTMLIDHIGYLLYPQYFFLRIIGRLSFPIFAYLIATGARRTHSPSRYAFRLLLFGLISQVPYNLFTQNLYLSFQDPNIFFTLLAGLLLIYCFREKSLQNLLFSLVILLSVGWLNLSYGYYGILLILLFYTFDGKPLQLTLAAVLATLVNYLEAGHLHQTYALVSLPIIFKNPTFGVKIPKWLGYGFYPVHLLMLFGIYFFWY